MFKVKANEITDTLTITLDGQQALELWYDLFEKDLSPKAAQISKPDWSPLNKLENKLNKALIKLDR